MRVRLLPALLFVIPLGASATIYQWTDEAGHVVLGNQVPETARNVREVMKEDAARANGTQQLQAQQAQQYAPPAAYPTPPMPYPAAPAPMPADYYGAGYPGMYPPPYYPYGYGYGYPFVVTVVRPVHRFARVAHFRPGVTHFASRPVAAHFASRSVAMHHASVGRR